MVAYPRTFSDAPVPPVTATCWVTEANTDATPGCGMSRRATRIDIAKTSSAIGPRILPEGNATSAPERPGAPIPPTKRPSRQAKQRRHRGTSRAQRAVRTRSGQRRRTPPRRRRGARQVGARGRRRRVGTDGEHHEETGREARTEPERRRSESSDGGPHNLTPPLSDESITPPNGTHDESRTTRVAPRV